MERAVSACDGSDQPDADYVGLYAGRPLIVQETGVLLLGLDT